MRAFRATETVKCGGDEYTLAIDIEIIDAIEDEFDLGFSELLPEVIGKGRVGKVSRLLRGLLIRNHPELTLDDAGTLAMNYGEEFGEAISRLIIKARPEPEAEGANTTEENPPTARRGTGGSSSSHGARQTSHRSSSGAKRPALSS